MLENFTTDAETEKAVQSILNPRLDALGIGIIRKNKDTDKVYEASMDGTAVEAWITDLDDALQADEPYANFGLITSRSQFLKGVALTFKELNAESDYANLVRTLPVLKHWARAMRISMTSKPKIHEYAEAQRELALFFAEKMLHWPKSNTWYDNECLYNVGFLLEKWGSLRLVSQEGMEAWQKKLNEVLRMGNGFANAGAIPQDVRELGQAAIDEYMTKRANDKPSNAQWVYDQGLLQQHAYMSGTLSAADQLRKERKTLTWVEFTTYWLRFMVAARMRCVCLARARWRTNQANYRSQIANLLKDHREYYESVDMYLSAPDLDPVEKARQQRMLRRMRFKGVDISKGDACKARKS